MKLVYSILFALFFFPSSSFAKKNSQKQIVSGAVTDEKGNPLSGVDILNSTTNQGTTSDFDGNYKIEAVAGHILTYSYLGYSNTQITLGNKKGINVMFGETVVFQKFALIESNSEKSLVIANLENNGQQFSLIPCWNSKRLRGLSQFDSRFEKFQMDSLITWQSNIRKQTESVAIIIEKEKLFAISEEEYQIDISNTLGEAYNLCVNQAFKKQPVIGTGTGFIINEDMMITAKHVFELSIENYVVIFGFELINQYGKVKNIISSSNIFYPKSVEQTFKNLDIIKFKVDRPFKRKALKWEASLDLKKNDEIYMIGNPSGLPTKIALNAEILDNTNLQFFYTSLDGFQGNSGSPIFNLCNNNVIGVLVSGQVDYEFNGSCFETTLCKYPYCKGEKIIRIENIMKRINN